MPRLALHALIGCRLFGALWLVVSIQGHETAPLQCLMSTNRTKSPSFRDGYGARTAADANPEGNCGTSCADWRSLISRLPYRTPR